jgi:fumarylacetoacetase
MFKDSYAGHFSGQNVPFGIASSAEHPEPQPVTRLQNTVIFLKDLYKSGLLSGIPNLPSEALESPTLNSFAALPTTVHRAVRHIVQKLYQEQGLSGFPEMSKEDLSQTTMHLPVDIRDFTGTFNIPPPLRLAPFLKLRCRYIVLAFPRS